MKRIKVKSSNIESIGYEVLDFAKLLGTLEVEFKGGGVYRYLEVPESMYEDMLVAESVGKFFSTHTKKGGYKFEKVEKDDGTIISSELYDYLTVQLDLPPKTIEKLKPLLRGEVVRWQEEKCEESLIYLVKELFKMLDTVEESDNGRVFRPTNIETCRVLHSVKLKEILPKIRKIIK